MESVHGRFASWSSTAVAERGPGRLLCCIVPTAERATDIHARIARKESRMSKTEPVFAGIDVAKNKLDLARSDTDKVVTISNDTHGIKKLVKMLSDMPPTLIVIEATGGYERSALDAMLEADLPVALAQPAHVRHLAKALGILAKTDAIDAKVLVDFARHAEPRLAKKRSKNRVELESLVTCRRQLIKVRTEQRNRLGVTHAACARAAIKAVLETIAEQVAGLDGQIRELIDSDEDMNEPDRIIRSVPGVGPVLSATLLAEMGELGSLAGSKISALAGVAPFNHDSGRMKGKRAIHGGRRDVRSVLYMATVAAIRCNPIIRIFAERLKASGKPGKVVIVAAMRKLLTIINAMLRDRIEWNQLKIVQRLT